MSVSIVNSMKPLIQLSDCNDSHKERIIHGNDERINACDIKETYPTKYRKSLAVAEIKYDLPLYHKGTAFRITKGNFMLTNDHVILPSTDMSNYSINFNNGCGDSTIVSADKIIARNEKLDYVLFSLNKNDFSKIKNYGYLDVDINGPVVEEDVYIPQHGLKIDENKKINNDKSISMYERIQGLYETKDEPGRVLYTSDTSHGASGSPVISEKTNKVVALHIGSDKLNKGINIKNIWAEIKDIVQNPMKKDGNNEEIENFSYSDLYDIFTDPDTYTDKNLSDALVDAVKITTNKVFSKNIN